MSDYMPNSDGAKVDLFLHVRDTIGGFLVPLGILPGDPMITGQNADATAFAFVFAQKTGLEGAAEQATAAKNRLRDGDIANPNSAVVLSFYSPPAVIPSPVNPGVIVRFRAFVTWLKANPNYTKALGEALRIESPAAAPPDDSMAQPDLSKLRLQGGQVFIPWKRNGMDALEIHVDRNGGGGFEFLTIDTVPDYLDTHALPATPARWKYKGIYRRKDQRVGQWSPVAEITVSA